MKRIYALILVFAMMLPLAACKDSSGGGSDGYVTPPSTGSDLTQAEINKILKEMEEE